MIITKKLQNKELQSLSLSLSLSLSRFVFLETGSLYVAVLELTL